MAKASAPTRVKRCAICGQPADARFQPFCSKRCADVDLNRWLSGVYAIPTAEAPDDNEPESPPEDGKD